MIEFRVGNDLNLDQVIDLYVSSGIDRPTSDRKLMGKMLEGANLVVTAWDGNDLVGIARSVTDWSFCTYLSDLAVDGTRQRSGIGKALIERTIEETGKDVELILLAAPEAETYYPKIGFKQYPACFCFPTEP